MLIEKKDENYIKEYFGEPDWDDPKFWQELKKGLKKNDRKNREKS